MKNYKVIYEIVTIADSPLQAALKVESYMKDAGSYRPVLDVTDENGETTRIDLEDDTDTDTDTDTETRIKAILSRKPAQPELVKVYDMESDKEISFDALTDPTYAVRYAYVTEDRPELASWFFNMLHDKNQDAIELKLPVIKSATTVCCGAWVTKR